MPWGALAGAVVGIAGSAMSSGAQSSAAETAAADQEQAAMAQMGLDSSVFNAQSQMNLPSREVGGLAQSREAYLLGLSPDLNINQDFESPQISFNAQNGGTSSLSYVDANGNPIGNGYGSSTAASGGYPAGSSAYGPTGPVSFGGQTYGYAYPNGSSAAGPNGSGAGSFSLAGGGYAAPVSATPAPTSLALGGSGAPIAGSGSSAGAAIPNPNAALPSGSYGSFASPYNPSTFYEDPGYQFIQQQGQQQIQNQQATTGMALSPAALGAALSYNSGLASQEFNNAYNRSINTQTTQLNELNALSSGGQIATSGVSSAASNLGTAGSSAIAGYGNAGAAGAIGVGNAISSGINGGVNSAYGAMYGSGGLASSQYSLPNMFSSTPSSYGGSSGTTDLGGNQSGYIINTPD